MSGKTVKHIALTSIWLLVAIVSLAAGLEYYTLPLHDRAYSDLHELYKPSGFIGHGMGIIGSLMMIVGVAMYSVRKRVRRFEQSGQLRNWLTIHIFLCTLGPWLVLLHTAFRFGGVISIAFWSMIAVVLSGIFGRYIYVRIPKATDGQFLSESALLARQKHLLHSIKEYHNVADSRVSEFVRETAGPQIGDGWMSRLLAAIKRDLSISTRRKALLLMARSDGMADAESIVFVRRVMDYQNLVQQTSVSGVFQRLFGYWHVFHLPLALIMLAIMLLHIGVAFTFGYFWIT